MWEAGVQMATHNNLLYLDSDRVLPTNYLSIVMDNIQDDRFLFCDGLFGFHHPVDDQIIIDLLDQYTSDDIRSRFSELEGLLYYDPRYRLPLHGPGKGAMSGNTAFTRMGYWTAGGVDPWFEGHGAYADTDFHKQVFEAGFELVPLDVQELHIWHSKLSDQNDELTRHDIEVLSLNNFIYHCRKWELSMAYPRAIAAYLGLGKDFVDRVLRRIDTPGRFHPIFK